MKKFVAIAALLGFAASKSVSAWTKGDNLVNNEWLTVDYSLEADFGYGTFYEGHAPKEGIYPANAETYGVQIYSEATAKVEATILKHRKLTAEFTLVPINIVPFQETVVYERFEDEIGNAHVFHEAGRDIRALDYTLTINTNVKTARVSIWDYIDDKRDKITPQDEDWTYNEDYKNKYNDPYYSGNILEDLEKVPTGSWYGYHTYYDEKKLF